MYWRSPQNEQPLDLYSRLLRDRIILLNTELNSETANFIIANLLFLEAEDPDQDIFLHINHSGSFAAAKMDVNSVMAGMSIYDTLMQIRPEISTVCLGFADGMSAFLLSAGTRGKRFALPHARMRFCQPSVEIGEPQRNVEQLAQEVTHWATVTQNLLAKHTGRSPELVAIDLQRDFFLSAEAAKAYGVIDAIISQHP
jgi:ATP-dependent Clp protease, protease subunit